jgi:DNA (cytosine-5)-methyltransferase 1
MSRHSENSNAKRSVRVPAPRARRVRPAPIRHRVVGLFAGIGGIERGLHRAGHETLLLCENDLAARAVLADKFPGVPCHEDVRELTELPVDTTLIAAGFPCQDLSQAGMTSGIEGAQSGLVGEVIRLVRRYRTPWVLLENVPFMLQLARGEAMNVITTAFEQLGYRWAYRVVDARAFGRPQRRRRVYFLAARDADPRTVLFADDIGAPTSEDQETWRERACGFYWTEGTRGLGWADDGIPTLKGGSGLGIPSPPAIVLPSGAVVTPHISDAEALQGFPRTWTRAAERVGKAGLRWKLVGNAVSVDAASWIGRRLARPGRIKSFETTPLIDTRWPNAAWNMGEGRVRVPVSEWPQRQPYRSLAGFLKGPLKPLSAKATSGFLQRARQAKLNFPDEFLDVLDAHLKSLAPKPAAAARTAAQAVAAV